jgi:hypothetical protein
MNTSFPSIYNTNEDEIITHAEGKQKGRRRRRRRRR